MFVGIVTAGLVVVGVTAGVLAAKKKRVKLVLENIPVRLGVLDGVPVHPLLDQLNAALDEGYIREVKQRFLNENPSLTEAEFEWRLFELKRYFIMANLMKKAPMFSEEVDEIWHEMILFTQKYKVFSEKFLGEMLHHTPNINPEPAPQERAFFDWIFSQLFEITEYSWKTWGSFFKHPIDRVLLKEFKETSVDSLMNRYFQVNDRNRELVEYLVLRMKKQLNEAEYQYQVDKKGTFTKERNYGDLTSLSLVMVFFSYYYFDEYWEYAKVYAFAEAAKYTSGCSTAVFCGSASSDDSSGSDGGGGDSGGGSSCSSSSCGSSCGGGCSS